ncbi:hypothetical protein HOY34_14680 [Xinfangfangia sp. D13-10-4-6]|uniref:glycosyltransferase family 2 protein n=1 Tax=Pseudogemmobacter hezensis TaxID=2737662 RepID=UPI001555D7F1|nr:glycosyltransferase family 2 protein [Pseudogemmobacter hezensis]NPD16442.1 hypothetical protein [Pseudogemmobacter hezensis]
MNYSSIGQFLDNVTPTPMRGPIAIILAEDNCELAATLRHHLDLGFARVILLAGEDIQVPEALAPRIERIETDVFADDALINAVNKIAQAAPGAWLYYCYNAEFLFFPFCETRSISDLTTFHGEERRTAMLSYVIDLYASDLERYPNAVSLEDAHLDRAGYYALPRKDPGQNWAGKDRQMDFFGGLRWRFEEHVPWARRKIDRISLFRAQKGALLHPDYTFSDEEMNTYACPWHHNLTAAICSFRTAKALRTNPGSRSEIRSFRWHSSEPFRWNSQQLMDLGLMEPGQWF